MGGASGRLRPSSSSPFDCWIEPDNATAGGGLVRGGGGLLAMQAWAKSFYFSPAWRSCRSAYIKRVGGLCERCLARGIYRSGEIVHHKIHLTPENIGDPTVSCAFANLELLCRDCHAQEHGRLDKRYSFDDDGRCVTKAERTDANVV